MIKTKMIPLQSVLKDVYFLLRESDVVEDLAMEFAIRGMEHMAVYHTYEKAVCILRVENSQAAYPQGMYGVESVMYKKEPLTAEDIQVITTANVKVDTSNDNLLLDKEVTCKLTDFRQIHFDSGAGWNYLELSNNTFDRSILCEGCVNLSVSCKDWFIPDSANSRFITNFDDGWLAVAYYRFPQNEEGQFIVPDHPLYNEALESYVLCKIFQRMWHMSKQGAQGKYTHYLSKWQELSAAATGELMMLSLPDYINLDKQNKFFRDDSPLKIFGGYGKETLAL